MTPGAWTTTETPPPRIGRAAAPRPAWAPPYSVADFGTLLWRERFLMLVVFMVVFGLAVGFSMTLKKTYTAYAAVLVQLGQEYVYAPSVGDAGRGTPASAGQIMQSELSILNATAVKEQALAKVGLARVYPKLDKAAKTGGRTGERLALDAAVRAVGEAMKIETAPETSVVRLSFAHEDSLISAQMLNALIEEYLTYRKEVLVGADGGVLNEQRRLFERRLAEADSEYQQFLAEAGVGDFETEKASLAAVYSALLTERFSVQAQLSEVQGRLGVTRRQAGEAPPEMSLYRDTDPQAVNKLMQLKVERQDLLSRYKPGSQPVREVEQKIGALEALIAQGAGQDVSTRRIGPNPVYQSLATEKNQLEAQAASLRSRAAAVAGDLAQVNARRQRLIMLEPRYQDLVRERDVLSTNVKNFTAREQESQAQRAIALKGEDNIRVVERAYAPTKAKSLKKPVIALGFLFGAFTAICAALARILLRRGFVTPEATARALDLPVLGTAPLKRASA